MNSLILKPVLVFSAVILLVLVVLGFTACDNSTNEYMTNQSTETTALMHGVVVHCRQVNEESHAFLAPVNTKPAIRYACHTSIDAECSVWISEDSFNSGYKPVQEDLDDACQ